MKVYREWQISGDDDWLRRMMPLARRSLEFCQKTWDPGKRGALFESHHNTYDIEFFGPDGMCTSIYIGAMRAYAEMAEYLGEAAEAKTWRDLAKRGQAFADRELFNGEYYYQKIIARGLNKDFDKLDSYAGYMPEARALARQEGPKYQYGTGCLADGVIGQWFAEAYGSPDALDRGKTRASLASIFRYNFRPSLREHANPQRATYALNDEPGVLICTWPKGKKLSLPFIYSDEVWTGIEYQVASHCIYEGLVDEGLTIVKAARDRYEGFKRNPWNEYECGSYYARAMSSYAVLTALTGFRYSAVAKEAVFDPRLDANPLTSFFSTASGWGRFSIKRSKSGVLEIAFELEEGALELRSIRVPAPATGNAFRSAKCAARGIVARLETIGGTARAILERAAIAKPGERLAIAFR
ncbi:MAG: hypothetical protein BWZ10_03197 [candidate division BRC1 bacterium ADurb.BinA364]|nr:MAG: hypothetical protein BWZ10_03197 [candidate division BRC1 bacterium ADurb.BinA364]